MHPGLGYPHIVFHSAHVSPLLLLLYAKIVHDISHRQFKKEKYTQQTYKTDQRD